MVDAVEGSTEVEQAEQRDILTIRGAKNQTARAKRCLCRLGRRYADCRRCSRSCGFGRTLSAEPNMSVVVQ